MTGHEPVNGIPRSRVLLLGDAAARPEGLERALVRAGLALDETMPAADDAPPDLVLITVRDVDESLRPLLDAAAGLGAPVPRLVLIASGGPDAPARAVAMGADEAVAAPPTAGEYVARLAARIGLTVDLPRLAPRPAAASRDSQAAVREPLARPQSPDLDSRLRDEFERARRYALSFSLVLIGIEQFAGLSDRLGSERADRMLSDVGDVLRAGVRAPDFVSRYAGEEFALLLPETSGSGARQSVTRVRDQVVARAFDGLEPGERPEVTAGIVTFPHPAAARLDDLFALAEAALLRARNQSGDRIGTAESAAT